MYMFAFKQQSILQSPPLILPNIYLPASPVLFRLTGTRQVRPSMLIDMNAGKGCSSCGK